MHPSDLIERLEDPHRRLVLSDRQEAAERIRQLEAALEGIANEAEGRPDNFDQSHQGVSSTVLHTARAALNR